MFTVTLRNTFAKYDSDRIVVDFDDAKDYVSDWLRETFKATQDETQREYCQDLIEKLHKGIPSYGRGIENSIAYDIVDYGDWKRHQDEQVEGLVRTIREMSAEIEADKRRLAQIKGT